MKKIIILAAIAASFVLGSCATTQECRPCPMWNQKYSPEKCDSVSVENYGKH